MVSRRISPELSAGQLDRRIRIERATITTDSMNNPVQTWAELATVWASKTDISDGERFLARERGAEITTRFQVRWSNLLSDLNPKDRVVYRSVNYNIVGVKEMSLKDGLEITAAARPDQ